MWQIKGRDAEGKPRDLAFTEFQSGSREEIHKSFVDITGGTSSEIFDREMAHQDPLPGVDGIESWGNRAADLTGPDGLLYDAQLAKTESQDVPGLLLQQAGQTSRLAARELLKHYDVRLMTYGTPHKGTPLANAGKRIFSALLAGGRTALLASGGAALGSVFSWDPPSLGGKLLLKGILPKGFPPGLDAMRPESDFIGSLSAVTEPYPLRTWGAKCEVDGLPSGTFAFAIRDAIYGAFGGSANDTAVGAASATGAGKAQKIFDACTHFQYFSVPEVKAEIQSLS